MISEIQSKKESAEVEKEAVIPMCEGHHDAEPKPNIAIKRIFTNNEAGTSEERLTIVIKRIFTAKEEGTYILLPFDVPERIERIDLSYTYARFIEETTDGRTARLEQAIIDLFVHDAEGSCVGSSGSERTQIFISGYEATPGFRVVHLTPGVWAVGAGVYKVPPSGMEVTWTVTLTPKRKQLFRGDTHVHKIGRAHV